MPAVCGGTTRVCTISLRTLRGAIGGPMATEVGWCIFSAECLWHALGNGIHIICEATVCGDVKMIQHGAWYVKVLGVADIVLTFVPVAGEAAKAGETALRLGIDIGDHLSEQEAAGAVKRIAEDAAISCITECFPAGTQVATPEGRKPIERVRVGEQVLTEDPKTGKVETEAVTAVRHDPPTWVMAIGLADGSTIEVTPEHPFWVDRGGTFAGPGWLKAGELRIGDQLRTAGGADATVVSLRYHVERVEVYTLTLGSNHDFFVGDARVLVHNCNATEIANSLARVEQVRNTINVGKDRNIAIADISIGGTNQELVGVSGAALRPGTVPPTINHLFTYIASGPKSRTLDAESKILEYLAAQLPGDATGTIRLFSELPVCTSCSGVISQFEKRFPGINVTVASGPLRP